MIRRSDGLFDDGSTGLPSSAIRPALRLLAGGKRPVTERFIVAEKCLQILKGV
jgi:hypothetical protein